MCFWCERVFGVVWQCESLKPTLPNQNFKPLNIVSDKLDWVREAWSNLRMHSDGGCYELKQIKGTKEYPGAFWLWALLDVWTDRIFHFWLDITGIYFHWKHSLETLKEQYSMIISKLDVLFTERLWEFLSKSLSGSAVTTRNIVL